MRVFSAARSQVAPDQPLMEAGLDSLGAVELRNALGARFGIEMPATLTFDHPSITALAAYVSASLPKAAGPRPHVAAMLAHAASTIVDALVAEMLGPVRSDQVHSSLFPLIGFILCLDL